MNEGTPMTAPTTTRPDAPARPDAPGTAARAAGEMPGRSTSGWWEVDGSQLLVHRHDPAGDVRRVVLVVAPPSNEALTTHRTERTLAARLVDEGCAVVRLGLSDTSSSAFPVPDARPLFARWEDEIAGALRHAAALYDVPVVDVVSTRVGATLAANAASRPDVPAGRAVLLAPVGSGRTYLRSQTQLLTIAAESNGLPRPYAAEADGSVPTYGMTLDPASAQHLRAYTLTADPAGVDLHVVAGADKPLDKTARALVAAGATHHDVEGLGAMLDRISSYALVPTAVLDTVVRVLTGGEPSGAPHPAPPADPADACVVRTPAEVSCEVVDVDGMPGLVTRPVGEPVRVLVWSPGATEPHDGPSGIWAHMARRLAVQGVATVRFDLADSGERTRVDSRVDVYPYEQERVTEVARAIAWARRTFGMDPDVGGLCAGAWLAIAAAAVEPVRSVVPVNIEQWTADPTVIERVDADPELGYPREWIAAGRIPADPGGLVAAPVEDGGALPADGGLLGRIDVPGLKNRARTLAKERMPYVLRVELGRRHKIQAPEPFLEAATRNDTPLRALLTQRDYSVFTRLHGHRAMARLQDAGRDIVFEVDAAADHGLVMSYTRDRVVAFVRRALLGTDIFY